MMLLNLFVVLPYTLLSPHRDPLMHLIGLGCFCLVVLVVQVLLFAFVGFSFIVWFGVFCLIFLFV